MARDSETSPGAIDRFTDPTTIPGKPFTPAVLASLPLLTTSAKAATLGAVAAKATVAAKTAAGVGLLNAILSPVLGLVGPWLQYRAFLDAAQTDKRRKGIRSYYHRLLGLMLGFAVLLAALIILGGKSLSAHPLLFAGALIGSVPGQTRTSFSNSLKRSFVLANSTRVASSKPGRFPPITTMNLYVASRATRTRSCPALGRFAASTSLRSVTDAPPG